MLTTIAALCRETEATDLLDLEQCTTAPTDMKEPKSFAQMANRSYAGSKRSLAQSITAASKENLLAMPYIEADPANPITTSFFDLFKIGPGPSSSHTIGPMKAAFDFLQDLRNLFSADPLFNKRPEGNRFRIEIHLYGSLSATGKGHKTHTALVGGLMGWLPATCDSEVLCQLMSAPGQRYLVPIMTEVVQSEEPETPTDVGSPAGGSPALTSTTSTTSSHPKLMKSKTNSDPQIVDLGEIATSHIGEQDECGQTWFSIETLAVGTDCFIWHDPNLNTDYPHPNTVVIQLISNATKTNGEPGLVVHEGEYYSVGGGFIMKKGCEPEDCRSAQPVFKYTNMTELRAVLNKNPTLSWHEMMLTNEMALTGLDRPAIEENLDRIIDTMLKAVDRGLATQGVMPGRLKLRRKAAMLYENARQNSLKADSFLQFLNAYCYAASEENAVGHVVVTAPTSGASGVFPGLIYFMKHHLFYSPKEIRDALMVAGSIGFLVKRNASISGAEMGCMGEVGTASCMGAAMLAYSAGLSVGQVEAAAEIAMEHHLGLTCDPIGGEVQVPCIQRNPFGAIKAYNAYLMSSSIDPTTNKISLDCVINTMRETGRDMSLKYKETSEGGLATNFTFC